MANSVTFPPEIGGDGQTYTDDSNAQTGMANGGHRVRFIPALANIVEVGLSANSSAVAAGLSEVAAASSETNAAASELAAASSETNAAASELAAASSETNAAASELAAKISEDNAAISQSDAALSESNSSNSEYQAKISENNAANSEISANNSKEASASYLQDAYRIYDGIESVNVAVTNSESSEAAALVSENAAKVSEGKALSSENAAKTSETKALASENAAFTSEGNAASSESAAKISETNALASENAASLSESKALSSENSASLSESKALASEGAAATSESNTAASESAAKISETNSAASELAASNSESAASASESAAKISETKALASEGAAATSESNAVASESAAKISETNSAASELAASNSESAALASEGAAKTSETKALASEGAAATSESNAAASESAATISETNAASSESNAAASESSASSSQSSALISEESAKNWAEKPYNQQVLTGKYSALHHSSVANSHRAAALQSAVDSSNARTGSEAAEDSAKASELSAVASKNAASVSESNAASSESAAALSESNAGKSETAASVSESNAAASESAASASESNAATSRSAAKASENESEQWATSLTKVDGTNFGAKKYAQNAAASENNASLSESNAASSQSAAKTSETNAKASQNAASTSEANAANSKAAASNSEHLSQAWATQTSSPVAGDLYGAKYYAEMARDEIVGTLVYQGTWNATTAFPSNPKKGHLYKVNVAGGKYNVGDQIIFNGTGWDHVDNTEQVTSVGGNIGDITDAQIRESVKRVDGSGSGLDADTVDGLHANKFVRVDRDNQINGKLTVSNPNNDEGAVHVYQRKNDPDSPAAVLIATDDDGDDISLEIRGNASGSSVDTSDRSSIDTSPDMRLQVWSNGDVNTTGAVEAASFSGNGSALTSVDADTVDGKHASAFADASHSHPWSQVTGKPATSLRWPSFNEVSSKPATATRWPGWSEVTGKPGSFTPSAHNHSADHITSGVLTYARIPTIRAQDTNFSNQTLNTNSSVRHNKLRTGGTTDDGVNSLQATGGTRTDTLAAGGVDSAQESIDTAGNVQVRGQGQVKMGEFAMQYNSTTQSLDFNFLGG